MSRTYMRGIFGMLACAFLFSAGAAYADTTTGLTNDGYGGTFTLTVTGTNPDGSCTNCTVMLTINTQNLTNPSKDAYIDAVAWKLGNGATVTGTTTGPSGATWLTPTYTSLNSGNNSTGPCTSFTGDVQTCTAAGSPIIGVATGGTLKWTWTGVVATDSSIAHVGYQYNNGTATSGTQLNGQIVSLGPFGGTTTKVPEPATLSLLLAGLAGLGIVRRRKRV